MFEKLYLQNQICFPFYAISRNIIKRYTPFLSQLNLTYPQYLVMLVLWEKDNQCITDICKKVHLETNTLSPLIKTLLKKGLVDKKGGESNNKQQFISLTDTGKSLRIFSENIPDMMREGLDFTTQELQDLHKQLYVIMKKLDNKKAI